MTWPLSALLTTCLGITLVAQAESRAISRPQALSIVFLYDASVSVTYLPIASDSVLRQVTEWVVEQLRAGDSFRYGFVINRLQLSPRFGANDLKDFYRAHVQKAAISDADRFGPSPLWDALDSVVAVLAKEEGRRAIIVMTDGRSTGNRHGVNELVNNAKASRVSIWPVDYSSSEWFQPDEDGRPKIPADLLISIAVETGGGYIGVPPPLPSTMFGPDIEVVFDKTIGPGLKPRIAEVFAALRR